MCTKIRAEPTINRFISFTSTSNAARRRRIADADERQRVTTAQLAGPTPTNKIMMCFYRSFVSLTILSASSTCFGSPLLHSMLSGSPQSLVSNQVVTNAASPSKCNGKKRAIWYLSRPISRLGSWNHTALASNTAATWQLLRDVGDLHKQNRHVRVINWTQTRLSE